MKEFFVQANVSGASTKPSNRRKRACLFSAQLLTCCFLLITYNLSAQPIRVALVTPDETIQARIFSETLGKRLASKLRVLDSAMSETAFSSFEYQNPFNLELREAQNAGRAIGCDYFLLIRSRTLRRDSPDDNRRFESYAAVYTVSSRTGRLIFWTLVSGEGSLAVKAEEKLLNSIGSLNDEILIKIAAASKQEGDEESFLGFEELPADDSPAAVNFRPPLPYRRISPKYTELADLYAIEATVDIMLDVDETGKIVRSEISRWAGFGLDESVTKTVVEMNWRPAYRKDQPRPVRVLLRYNFKDIRNPEPKAASLHASARTQEDLFSKE